MDTLTVILIAVAAFVIFVLLTAYFMRSALYMNEEVSKAKMKKDNEKTTGAAEKKDNGN